jgi:hypothetical protein
MPPRLAGESSQVGAELASRRERLRGLEAELAAARDEKRSQPPGDPDGGTGAADSTQLALTEAELALAEAELARQRTELQEVRQSTVDLRALN